MDNPPKRLSWIPFYKILAKPFLAYTKKWDLIAAQRPDKIIAISKAVKSRIKKYYERDSEILFPPVEIKKFAVFNTSVIRINKVKEKVGDYYLVVSRLIPYKRVDLAIEAFINLNIPLNIVGTGSEESKYKSKYKSKKNINFLGFVEENELWQLYHGAKALIMPQEEDFGLVSVEAQALGCPVIAYKKGGALDTIVEGKTGLFFNEQSVYSLVDAVKRFDRMKFSTQNLIDNAKRFSKISFRGKFNKIINSI